MDIIKGQGILIQWFRHNSQNAQSIAKIRIVCKNIRNQLGDSQNKNYLYFFLFPLVRIGLVEFIGEGKYSLSPLSLIQQKDKLVSINLNDIQLQQLNETIIESQFHQSVVYHKTKYVKEIEVATGLKFVKPNVQKLLTQIPIINDIIDQYEQVSIFDSKGFMFHNNNFNWSINYSNNLLGCFKAGENVAARRYLKVNENEWKQIPSRKINPDSFNWAYCYGRILNDFSLDIEYDEASKTLKIRNIYFPIILERLLYLNDLDINDIKTPNETVFRNISPSIFTALNKIFLNKLKQENRG